MPSEKRGANRNIECSVLWHNTLENEHFPSSSSSIGVYRDSVREFWRLHFMAFHCSFVFAFFLSHCSLTDLASVVHSPLRAVPLGRQPGWVECCSGMPRQLDSCVLYASCDLGLFTVLHWVVLWRSEVVHIEFGTSHFALEFFWDWIDGALWNTVLRYPPGPEAKRYTLMFLFSFLVWTLRAL
jgi:hypothetical protein